MRIRRAIADSTYMTSITETRMSVMDGVLWEVECSLCQLILLHSDVRKTLPRMRYSSTRVDEFTL